MVQQIFFGFKLVTPLFIIMALGALFRRRQIIALSGFRDLNTLAYRLFLPANVFYSIATADRSELFHPVYSLILLVGIGMSYVFARLIAPRLTAQPAKQGVIIQAMVRGNFVIIGLSLLQIIYGPSGLDLAGITLLISMPLFNLTSILALDRTQARRSSGLAQLKKVLLNPFIIATMLGLSSFLIPLPELLMSPIELLARAAGTIAIFSLGGVLELRSLRSNQMLLNIVSLIRLFILPALAVLAAFLLKQTEQTAMTLMMFFGAPVAVLSHAMVLQLGGDEELSGQLILYTTILSLISYAFWIGLIRFLFI